MKKLLVLVLFLISGLSWAENAKLTVVTDLPSAKIYIDGQFVGIDAIQGYQVEPGEHYVMVNYRDKKIFARTYTLAPGEVKTIPTAHFVDFKTSVASRGAVDVEAARIRDTRGNFGLGIYGTSSLGGISLKKWFGERFGLQAFGFINNEEGATRYQSGGRVLLWLADKVVGEAPFSGYLFLGGGSDSLINNDNSEKNIRRSIASGGFGIEFSSFGVNGLFASLELGSEKHNITYSDPNKSSKEIGQMIAGLGFHFYF